MYMSESKLIVAGAPQRIDSVLDAEPVPQSAEPKHPKDGSVALKDIHFGYDDETEVIKGVSMDIASGQTVALVGPSVGGKSTLASLIVRFFDVKSGSIAIGGADVRDIPKAELMDTVSFVFQNSRLLMVGFCFLQFKTGIEGSRRRITQMCIYILLNWRFSGKIRLDLIVEARICRQ